MSRYSFLLTIGLLFCLSACTRFPGIKPLEPTVGRPAHYTKVDSLTPELRWTASPESGATYDLAICPAEDAHFRIGHTGKPGKAVYYREALAGTSHRVETPLEPKAKYLWSVRVRTGQEVSDWATYEYMHGGRIGEQFLETKLPFRFRTPKKPE